MAGERLGSALAVRSAAPRLSGAPSFGPNRGSFESVRFSNPNLGRVLIKGGDSQLPAPFFRFEPLRPRQLNAIRAQNIQSAPPEVVVEPVSRPRNNTEIQPNIMPSPKVEIASTISTQPRGRILFFPAIRPLESKPVPAVNPEIVKVPEKSRSLNILEQQVLLSQIRRSLMRTRSLRGDQSALAKSESLVTPVVQTVADSSPAFLDSSSNQAETQFKTLPRREETLPAKLRRVNSSLERGKKQLINIESGMAVVDEKTNRLRIKAIIASRDKLRARGQLDRQAVVNESGIAYLEDFKSPIVGKRWDGTLPRTGKDILAGEGELTNEEIFRDVTRHSALKRSKDGISASHEQLYEVMTHPELPYVVISEEEILPVKKEIKIVEADEPVVRNPVFEPPVESKSVDSNRVGEVRIQPFYINQDFVRLVFDMGAYSIDAFKRRELVEELAA